MSLKLSGVSGDDSSSSSSSSSSSDKPPQIPAGAIIRGPDGKKIQVLNPGSKKGSKRRSNSNEVIDLTHSHHHGKVKLLSSSSSKKTQQIVLRNPVITPQTWQKQQQIQAISVNAPAVTPPNMTVQNTTNYYTNPAVQTGMIQQQLVMQQAYNKLQSQQQLQKAYQQYTHAAKQLEQLQKPAAIAPTVAAPTKPDYTAAWIEYFKKTTEATGGMSPGGGMSPSTSGGAFPHMSPTLSSSRQESHEDQVRKEMEAQQKRLRDESRRLEEAQVKLRAKIEREQTAKQLRQQKLKEEQKKADIAEGIYRATQPFQVC